MKKCKYHCDYGDGEYCHYEGKSGCVNIEQPKKEIKLHKKYTFSLKRTDEFSMRRLYEIICETLMDEGWLVISRTDDHEKVDFVWEIRDN